MASLTLSAAPATAQITVTYDPGAHSIDIEGDSAADDIYVEEGDNGFGDQHVAVMNQSMSITAPPGCTGTGESWITCPRVPDADDEFDVVIDGGGGNDVIRLGCSSGMLFPDSAEVYGGPGDDEICGSFAGEYIEGGPGDDKIDGSKGDDWVVGGGSLEAGDTAGTDLVYGGPGNDLVSDGDDDSSSEAGAVDDDQLSGGACTEIASFCRRESAEPQDLDAVDWSNRIGAVTIDLTDLSAAHGAEGESDTLDSFEGAVGGAGDDTFTGDSLNNYFDGGPGADTIAAGDGSDYLIPGSADGHRDGTDTVDGGAREDLVSYEDRTDPVRVDMLRRRFGDITDQELDEVTNVEDAAGGQGNDVIVGDTGPNAIFGLAGDDAIDVSFDGIADYVDCGGGNDSLVADTLDESDNCEPPPAPDIPAPSATGPASPPAFAPSPSAPPVPAPVVPMTISLTRSKAIHVARNGAFDVPFALLACPFALPDKCTVAIALLPSSGRGKPLGAKGMTIAAGRTLALHSGLTARAMKLLRRRGKLVLRVRVDASHGSAAHAQREFRLTLLPPRRR